MDKIIWSDTFAEDALINSSREEKIEALMDYGYDKELTLDLSDEKLNELIWNLPDLHTEDISLFDNDIEPMINSQTKDGLVLMFGEGHTWKGPGPAGKVLETEDLAYVPGYESVEIVDDGNGLVWKGHHHDGVNTLNLYALPEDKDEFAEFAKTCMEGCYEDEKSWSDDELTFEEWVEGLYNGIDANTIHNYCEYSKVPSVCHPIKNITESGVQESCENLDEAKSKDPEALEYEVADIKAGYEDFGPDGFYAMSFSDFENQYPEFTKTCIRTFLKDMEILEPEELEDEDLISDYWSEGTLIQPDDWPCLIDGAERLTTTRKDKGIQWEKIWAAHFDSPYLN